MKRFHVSQLTVLLLLPGAALLFLLCPPAANRVKGMFMLFQQRSAHVLIGYIQSSGCAPLAAVLLAAWQGAFLPWQPCRTVIAAAAVLGKPLAVLLCLAGQLLACGFWYFLSRGLVSPFFTGDGKAGRRRPAAWYAAAAGLFVPGWAAPLSAVPGALGARARTAVPLLALAALPRLALTACLCSQMSAALPFPWSWVSPGAGCIAVLTSVWARRAHARHR